MRISIITPTIDTARYVDNALESVRRAEHQDIEHIIVHDGNLDTLQPIRVRYPEIKIIPGPGNGPGPAVAAAIEVATGDFILQLNSDDRLATGALKRLAQRAAARPDVRIWTGGARLFRMGPDGREIVIREILADHAIRLDLLNVLDDLPLLTARFIHRSVFEKVGNLAPEYPFSNDREFLLRAVMAGITDEPLDLIVSEIREHEGSRTFHGSRNRLPPYLSEHLRIADGWLTRRDVPARSRRILKNWRAREVLRLAVYQFRAGAPAAAIRTLASAQRDDISFPVRAATTISARRRRRRIG